MHTRTYAYGAPTAEMSAGRTRNASCHTQHTQPRNTMPSLRRARTQHLTIPSARGACRQSRAGPLLDASARNEVPTRRRAPRTLPGRDHFGKLTQTQNIRGQATRRSAGAGPKPARRSCRRERYGRAQSTQASFWHFVPGRQSPEGRLIRTHKFRQAQETPPCYLHDAFEQSEPGDTSGHQSIFG